MLRVLFQKTDYELQKDKKTKPKKRERVTPTPGQRGCRGRRRKTRRRVASII